MGEFTLTLAGEPRSLHYGANALCDIEREENVSFMLDSKHERSAQKLFQERMSFQLFRTIVWAGTRRAFPDNVSLEAIGDMIDDQYGSEWQTVAELCLNALTASFGTSKKKKASPKKDVSKPGVSLKTQD